MSSPIFYCDTETTGLLLDRHEIWEVAAIFPDSDTPEHRWFLPVNLGVADPFALDIGGFHKRHPDGHQYRRQSVHPGSVEHGLTDRRKFSRMFAELTHGLHMVGAVPSFDDYRLAKLLRENGEIPSWHYHVVDVEALAAGHLATRNMYAIEGGGEAMSVESEDEGVWVEVSPKPPWDSFLLSRAVGVDPNRFDRHTALDDARWAKAVYEAVMG